jgi:hypothetical protein
MEILKYEKKVGLNYEAQDRDRTGLSEHRRVPEEAGNI